LTFKIVTYNPKYQNAVVELWKNCDILRCQNQPVEDIERKMNFQPQLFFIALLDGEVVGTVMVGYEGHRGWLNYLAVAPTYQRQGYGTKLVKKAIRELKKIGCPKVNLQVRKGNTSAVEFYKHIGFKEDEALSFGKRVE
jgi:ribosomal protein S18 acetylase RimI-like enzyme